MRGARGWALAAALLLPRPAAEAQTLGGVDYERLYGPVVDVRLEDLAHDPAAYERRAVRTTGRLDFRPGTSGGYSLRGSFGDALPVVPVPEVAAQLDMEARRALGQEVQVTGLVQLGSQPAAANQASARLLIWSFIGPSEETKGPIAALTLSLEALASRAGSHDGRTVRVVGKFRGRNLYGDLPARSARSSADWVIKDDVYAVWVSGRKPKGDGFELDAGLKRDTGKWLEVVGQPVTIAGITYIRAQQVKLSAAPSPTAEIKPPSPPPQRPKAPPVIVFALPLDGDPDVPPDSRFVVQFSKDMDEESFAGHVVLRYVGPVRPGDRPFSGMRLSYDGGRRALSVDPGDELLPGRMIELLLLPGIADVEGLPLQPRPGQKLDGIADALRYRVGL